MTDATLNQPSLTYSYQWASQISAILGQSSITLSDITATAAEINTLDGITSSTAELNKLDGVTSTTSELNLVHGLTGNIVTSPVSTPKVAGGVYIMTAADDVAGFSTISTGLTTITSVIILILDASHTTLPSDMLITTSGGDITISDGATLTVTDTYIVNWIVFGT